jgi:hypothetical protein
MEGDPAVAAGAGGECLGGPTWQNPLPSEREFSRHRSHSPANLLDLLQGLEYRMDFETGKSYARAMVRDAPARPTAPPAATPLVAVARE